MTIPSRADYGFTGAAVLCAEVGDGGDDGSGGDVVAVWSGCAPRRVRLDCARNAATGLAIVMVRRSDGSVRGWVNRAYLREDELFRAWAWVRRAAELPPSVAVLLAADLAELRAPAGLT